MLNLEELDEVIETVTSKIMFANRTGELEKLLEKWELSNLIVNNSFYDTNRNGKIVVIGQSEVKEDILIGVVKKLKLDKDRFEFCLEYEKTKTYPYKKLQYNTNYRVILFGPVPHSSKGKHNSSSVIAEMQKKEGYPRIEVLNGNNAVKITKSNFRKDLQLLIEENYI